MDADRFDTLARSLTSVGSRRRALGAALSGALGALGMAEVDEASAARSGKCKRKPGECERCDRGKCEKKDGKKRCKAGKIKVKASGTPCSNGFCQNGACTCTGLQASCSSSAECCSSTAACAPNFCAPGIARCCLPLGAACAHSCDCCGQVVTCQSGKCVDI